MITTGAAIFPVQSLVALGVQPDILARLRFSNERRHAYKFDHATVRNAVDVHIILCCRQNHVGQANIDYLAFGERNPKYAQARREAIMEKGCPWSK